MRQQACFQGYQLLMAQTHTPFTLELDTLEAGQTGQSGMSESPGWDATHCREGSTSVSPTTHACIQVTAPKGPAYPSFLPSHIFLMPQASHLSPNTEYFSSTPGVFTGGLSSTWMPFSHISLKTPTHPTGTELKCASIASHP